MIRGGLVSVPPDARDSAYFARMLRGRVPTSYYESLSATPDSGIAVLDAFAAIGARVSLAIAHVERDALLCTGGLGCRSKGTIRLRRTSDAAGVYYLMPGSVVRTAAGRRYTVLSTIQVSGLGPWYASIEATEFGYEYDQPASFTAANGETIYGPIDTWDTWYTEPAVQDTLIIEQVDAVTGGRSASLAMHARDRGAQQPDALVTAAEYYSIVVGAEDTLSAPAIEYALDGMFAAYGDARVLEVGTLEFSGLFLDAGASTDDVPDPEANYALDMDASDGWRVLLDVDEFRGFMLLVVPQVADVPTANALYARAYDMASGKHGGGVLFTLTRSLP